MIRSLHRTLIAALCSLFFAHSAIAFKPTVEFGHVGIVKDALTPITVPSTDGTSTYKFSERAILEIRDSTAGVDEIISARGELSVPKAHCDDELLPECTLRIIAIKNEVVALLTTTNPDGTTARREVGRALHTLQDFFAHSNWINISSGSLSPSTDVIPRLGPTVDTCERGFSSLGSGTLAGAGLTDVTTGYFSTVLAPPEGKCNHGLLLDPGIHKDEPSRTGHAEARAAAVRATAQLIREILDAPGVAGNDRAIRAFLDVRGAVGFVVDDTGSMGGVIAGVKSSIRAIVESVRTSSNPPDRYVFINFGDPRVGAVLVTASADELLARANSVFASGGGDCPELSMTGTLRAINGAPPGSQLYVFTDASSKDAGLAGNVITQARAKNISVSFLTFGSCSPIDPAYYSIAAESGGQLFALTRTASETEKIFGLVTPFVSSSPKPVMVAKGVIGGGRTFSVPVDPTARTLTVSVAIDASGLSRLFDPTGNEIVSSGPNVTVTPLSGGRLVSITQPAVGAWRLELSGAGNYDISIMEDSTLELNRFEFVEDRGREGHTGVFPIKSQPLAFTAQNSRATVLGSFATTEFDLVNEAGSVISTLPMVLESEGSNSDEFFASFILPSEKFRVLLRGTVPSGESFQRIYPTLFFGRAVKVEALGGGFGLLSPGKGFVQKFLVTNLGAPDSYLVTAIDERGFIGSVAPSLVALATNQSRIVDVSLTIPATTPIGTTNNISLFAKGAATANGTVFTQIVGVATIVGDLDSDGDVDRDDVSIIFGSRNRTASGSADGRDIDRDGKITVLDARKAVLLCTRPNCARE